MPPQFDLPTFREYRNKINTGLEHYDQWVKATDRWTSRNKFYDSEITTPNKKYKSDPSLSTRRKMPKTNRSRTSVKRRKNIRRGRRSYRRRVIPRALTSHSKIVRCKFVDYRAMSATGTLVNETLQLNNMDDPLAASGTGQPLGYDQWKALYKTAYVLSSRIEVKFHNTGTTGVMVGIYPAPVSQGTTSLGNYEYYMELPGSQTKMLSPEMDHCIISAARSTKRHLQVSKIRDNSDLRIDLNAETPASLAAYWHCFGQAVDQTSAWGAQAVITVSYVILLVDPIIPSRSVET